jgi:predicted secreted protein
MLEEVDHQFMLPGSEPPPPPGTPGQDVWTFKALKAGESTVSIAYSQPWEGGEKGTWTFVLSVSVQ